jgi:hypothetical protein
MNPFVYLFRITLIYIESLILSIWSKYTNKLSHLHKIDARMGYLLNKIEKLNTRFQNGRKKND